MTSFNSCTFSGRVGSDPEIRYLDGGSSVAEFSLAVDRYGKKGSDKPAPIWLRVTVWGRRAQIIADHVKKGSSLIVQGEFGVDEWEKDGRKNTKLTLNCSQFTFLDSGRSAASGGGGGGGGRAGSASTRANAPAGPQFQSRQGSQPDYDDEVPF